MTREQAEALRLDDKHWKMGVLYICQQDPRFIVRNRWKFGWAWNFGNLKSIFVLPVFILLFLSPFLLVAAGKQLDVTVVAGMLVVALVALVSIASYVANGPR